MENDREVDSVLMNVKNTSNGVVSAMMFSARMSWKMLSALGRLAKKGLVAIGTCDRFKDFHKRTGGEYTTYNIPLSEEKAKMVKELQGLELKFETEKNPLVKSDIKRQIAKLEKSIPEIQQLKKLGITHCVLPKINGSTNTIQIAIAKKDDQHFKNWFLNHLTTNLSGGEKSLESLKVFTEGNYSVLNMPFEEAEELGIMLSDFNTMGVNYAILPDLNIGDGYTQVAISNSDRSQVEQWFSMWKKNALSEGNEVKDLYEIDEESYTSTAEITPEDYVKSAEPEFQEAIQEFEAESIPIPWKSKLAKDNSPEFVKLMNDSNYEKITINVEKLVENQFEDNPVAKAFEDKYGFFVSRVPNTYGDNKQMLVLPAEQVFNTDNEKTVVAFLDKRKSYTMIDNHGQTIKKDVSEIKSSYDKVNRGFAKVKEFSKSKDIAKEFSKVPTVAKPVI